MQDVTNKRAVRLDADDTGLIRCDAGQITGKVERTDEGYIRGNAIVTRTGVFQYRNEDGSIRRELRHPDDVFMADSLASMRMIPVTNGHPTELVTAQNAADLSVGHVGENIQVDGRHVIAPLVVTHADGIGAIDGGREELSLGYTVDVVEEEGEYQGIPYTHRQRNVRYNHLALVDRARAGGAARLNMDGAAVQVTDEPRIDHDEDTTMKKVTIDGIEYDAAPEVAKQLERETARADQAEADAKQARTEKETVQAKYDEAAEELKQAKAARSDEAIRTAAKARVDLERKAAKVLPEDTKLDEFSDRQIKEKVIQAKHDGLELGERSDEYVQARFDAVIDGIPDEDPQAIERQRQKAADRQDGQGVVDSEKARRDSEAAIRNMYKPGKTGTDQ